MVRRISLLVASLSIALATAADGAQTWDVHVPSVHVTGSFLLNGQPFPESFLQGANFFLRNATGDEVYLGLSNDQSFDRVIVPGTYDIVYEHKVGAQVPQNTAAIVLSHVALLADTSFDVDVPSISLDGDFSLDGAPFPASVYENALISLRDRESDALTPLAETRLGAYAIQVIPGRYDLAYERLTGGTVIPRNALTSFARDVEFLASQTYDVDVPSVDLSGAFSINGAAPPASVYENGRIRLAEVESGLPFPIGDTSDQTYAASVIPGTYDVFYELVAGDSTIVPANHHARLLHAVDLSSSGVFDVDVPSIHVYGAILLNGDPAPASVYESGYVNLRAGDDLAVMGSSDEGSYSKRIVPGVYDVEWEHIAGIFVPRNARGHIATKTFGGSTPYDVDVRTAALSVDVLLNGVPFDLAPSGTAKLHLEDPDTGDVVVLPAQPTGDASGVYVRGQYRLLYSHDGAPELPINQLAVLEDSLALAADRDLQIDIATQALTGAFDLDGAAFPAVASQSGAIELVSTRSLDVASLGGTQAGTYSVLLLPGDYEARYNWYAGSAVPRNQLALLGESVRVPEPDAASAAAVALLVIGAVRRSAAA